MRQRRNTIYELVPGLRCKQYHGKVECVDFLAMQNILMDYYDDLRRQIFASQNVAYDAWFGRCSQNERQRFSVGAFQFQHSVVCYAAR